MKLKKDHICKYCSFRRIKHTFCLLQMICQRTFCRSAGRRLWSGYYSSACAAACWGVGDRGRLAEGGGGHAGGPLPHCGRRSRSGRMCEVARCGVCDVCRSETAGISSLEKQTSVNSFVQTGGHKWCWALTEFCSILKCTNNEDLLRAAEVNPVLPVPIKATGASEKESEYY